MNKREKINYFRNDKGITLVVLVVTIIVLIILAGISINLILGENGIVNRAKLAVTEQKKAQYMEELQMDIATAQIEILTDTSKNFVTNLYELISKREWVEKIEVYDDSGTLYTNEQEYYKGKILLITTKDDRILKINVDNTTGKATLDEEYYLATDEISVAVVYDKNDSEAVGNMGVQSVKNGSTITLPENKYTKPNFYFIGWSRYKTGKDETGVDDIHLSGSNLKIEGNTILYAQWTDVIIGESMLDILDNKITENGVKKLSVTGKLNDGTEDTVTYTANIISIDGNVTLDGTTTYGGVTPSNKSYSFGSINDCASGIETDNMAKNMVILKVNGDLTINSGVTLTTVRNETYGGPKGFLIYCTGTLTNNGTITMTQRGAYAVGQNVFLWKNNDTAGTYEYIPAIGGAGGKSVTHYSSTIAADVYKNSGEKSTIARGTGGGGTGACTQYTSVSTVGAGGNGTSYSGGSGSGAANCSRNTTVSSESASNYGGAGSDGACRSVNDVAGYAGGGAGNPGGYGKATTYNSGYGTVNSDYNGNNGTGGLLIVYSNKISNTGNMEAKGANGGYSLSSWPYNGGGSSGGGSINLFYKETINYDNTKINVDGGVSIYSGGAGGTGSISIGNISTGIYTNTYKNY